MQPNPRIADSPLGYALNVGQSVAPTPEPPRPGWVTAAGIILIVIGTIAGLVSLLFVVAGFATAALLETSGAGPGTGGRITDGEAGAVMAVFVVFGIAGGLWTASHVAAGIGVLKRRGWARVLGMVVSVLGSLFGLLMIALMVFALTVGSTALSDPELLEELENDPAYAELYGPDGVYADPQQALVLGVIVIVALFVPFIVAYVVALFALMRNGAFFSWRPAVRDGRPPASGGAA